MHTSVNLHSEHFHFRRITADGGDHISFDDFMPGYHQNDRVAVVSPHVEDGVLFTGAAVLAIATRFYDICRAERSDFFIYPQTFCILDENDQGIMTQRGRLPMTREVMWPWLNLDVWPDCKWLTSDCANTTILRTIFDYQINRVFWPEELTIGFEESATFEHLDDLLKSQIKSIHLYNCASPSLMLHTDSVADEYLDQCMKNIAASTEPGSDTVSRPDETGFYPVDVASFIEAHFRTGGDTA